MSVTVRRFWSPTLGMKAARISAFNDRGDEFFTIVGQAGTGRENRAERARAAETVHRAARTSGAQPGHVTLEEALA